MFTVSALLLNYALLKCDVTEIVLVSVVVFDTDISQGSVATYLRYDGIFSDSIINISPDSNGEKMKIVQYFTKL